MTWTWMTGNKTSYNTLAFGVLNMLWLLCQEFRSLHCGVQSEMAEEQREQMDNDVNFGPCPESNQTSDGHQSMGSLNSSPFLILMFWIGFIVWRCCLLLFWSIHLHSSTLLRKYMFLKFLLHSNEIVLISAIWTVRIVFTVISWAVLLNT